ncbi:putative beta-barrel porin [Jejuia pallidilutea]|uniref:Putative beta-barrel porin n=1 Tax=Jejuia pallidilutea TaxID=504487 RepID=A0A362X304_9FLAO|nr:putative porin [Jejuia pallidilutea]PQV51084.1 putative beta-barrel porin [Jejuia pallidilutea]
MQKLTFVLFFVLSTIAVFGQTNPEEKPSVSVSDSTDVKVKDSTAIVAKNKSNKESLLGKLTRGGDTDKKAKIQDYLIISHKRDTTYLDTTLTIQKEYKFNYLRKDNFGLMPFSNLGQTYNSLTYNFQNTNILPRFGARARHFNYMEIEDIYYYRVPTPLTELFYKTAFEQGQLADSFFTVNTSPQFNFSIAYKGMRSLGQYQHILTSTGNFRVTTNYTTKNKRYQMRGHIVMQDLLNEENGGLRSDMIDNFEQGVPEFLDRAIMEVNFENAESILKGKRFHLDHGFNIFNKVVKKALPKTLNDSTSTYKLALNHIVSFEDKSFQFDQSSQNALFGDAFRSSNLRDRVTLERLYNQLELNYFNNELGDFTVNINNTYYNYGYNKLVVLTDNTITNRLKGNIYAAGAKYRKFYKGFNIQGEAGLNLVGDFTGNYITGEASYNLTDDIFAKVSINHSSKAPNFNALLYQSNYQDFNWQNSFNNIETQQLAFQIKYKHLVNLSVDYSTISDYVYFKQDQTATASQSIQAFQNNATISYLRAKLENEIRVGKFALNNTVLYQNVQDDNSVLNVPEITTRNTFYFSSELFRKAMFLQTGITLNYFTKYYMNGYNPVLAEFYVQNEREFGEFPRLDFFINAKIRQTRIFLKAEHFNSAFTGYDYYSAPNYPYRDFTIRFGLVWNFFM